jgi:SecD/SecF fusion protein
VVGIAAIKDTSTISGMLRKPAIRAMLPRNLRLLWTVKPFDKEEKFLQLVAIKVTSRDGHAPLEGNVITDANGDFEQGSSKAEVSMSMNAEGAQTWKRLTGENIGKSIAIVLDDYVYSFPTVQSEIGGGRSSISGNFSINEAKDLANILKAGKLPARARIVQEDIVGPSLGKEAISAGLLSFLIALILVLLYMGFYYSKAGWVADLALFANVFFIMGILASLGAVLTLPGIAGIVLTIGLSVDANILIFERVREELAEGNSLKSAIRGGFKNAMSSIIDSNVTTLILGIILYVFGTGPIQGFATTLIIGILTSLFSAIFISRLIFEYMLDKNQDIAFAIPFTANAYKNININFVAKRKLYYIISGVIILAGVVAFMQKGLNLGVDFKGGRSYVIRFDKDVTPQEARDILASSL